MKTTRVMSLVAATVFALGVAGPAVAQTPATPTPAPAQPAAPAGGVEVGHPSGRQVDTLDAAADVVGRLVPRHEEAAHVVPLEATVVADVARAVGSYGGAVRTAAAFGDDRDRPVGRDA